jgi:protein arginine kinase activator
MSQCQACHEREAVVRLTQIVGDDVTTVHLCSKCAAERGIETDAEVAQTPLGAFLAAMGKGGVSVSGTSAAGEACPGCGASLHDFRTTGRVGCAECWSTFEQPLRDLLRRLHGATQHTGEPYRPVDPSRLSPAELQQRDRAELREELRAAIAAEQFERAAELRDRLRVLERS